MIDWSKLRSYEHTKERSFEELCYQISKVLYEGQGVFTPVDDSGGGDGVEFYITFPDERQWGWQAKFYEPDPRLSVSNRKASISGSLARSAQKHPRLERWILCTPTNFTTDEQEWFQGELRSEAIAKLEKELAKARQKAEPNEQEPKRAFTQLALVELEHWSASDFNAWLSEPRFAGKRNYFFGELELTLDWFQTQLDKSLAVIHERFNSLLHTETYVDTHIHALLADSSFETFLATKGTDYQKRLEAYREELNELKSGIISQLDWQGRKEILEVAAARLDQELTETLRQLKQAEEFVKAGLLDRLGEFNRDTIESSLSTAYQEYALAAAGIRKESLGYRSEDEQHEEVRRQVLRVIRGAEAHAASIIDGIRSIFARLSLIHDSQMHIVGDAGVGKTHVASNICHARLAAELPALLVLGREFNDRSPLQEQLLRLLDIPAAYSWSTFVQALSAAAEAYRTRIPVIIDGLNEATANGAFANIWATGLPGLVTDIARAKNVVLVTTSRPTYTGVIWPDGEPPNLYEIDGFDEIDVEDAVARYFAHYKIVADLTASPLEHFRHPIYLRIFCEYTNGARQTEKYIHVGEQTLFEIFEGYLKLCNRAVCQRIGLHTTASIVEPALMAVAEYLWNQRRRNVPLREVVSMIDHEALDTLDWQHSKTIAVLDEGLLVNRDWYDDGEIVFFTYDLMGGYLIARRLLEKSGSGFSEFLQSEEVTACLFGKDPEGLHPLHADIRRCLAAILPVKRRVYLHDLIKESSALSTSIRALFEIPAYALTTEVVELVVRLFGHPQNREPLLKLSRSTMGQVDHPLNVHFWSKELKKLQLAERDLSWTEHVRSNLEYFRNALSSFEDTCKKVVPPHELQGKRLSLLAEYFMWLLTTTVKHLRDEATRALYWYGRRQPEDLLRLLRDALKINDPYVSERLLAAAYGVVMARQYDFQEPVFANEVLPSYGRVLYDEMFRLDAPQATTHFISRDYAYHIIAIALNHHQELLSADEQINIRPPFQAGGIRNWGESPDRNDGEYRGGNYPLGLWAGNDDLMDSFGPEISKYESDTPQYQRALANIWWRVYGLGYSLERFGEVDREISSWSDRRSFSNTDDSWATGYGRKYAIIAGHELAGYRDDLGLLRGEEDQLYERPASQVDIDPSFPGPVRELEFIGSDFLGSRSLAVEEWIENGSSPDLASYLMVEHLDNEYGPWILLDAYIVQEDAKATRRVYMFAPALLTKVTKATTLTNKLRNQSLDGHWLYRPPEDYYTYAGEIPWCETYTVNSIQALTFVAIREPLREWVDQFVLFQDGALLNINEQIKAWEAIIANIGGMGNLTAETLQGVLNELGLSIDERRRSHQQAVPRDTQIEVLIPVRENNWESYHSEIVPGRNVATPAKQLTEHLNLVGASQTFDLYERNGRRASQSFQFGDPWHNTQRLVYLRQDLFQRYLIETGQDFVWAIWGAREFYTLDHQLQEQFRKRKREWRKPFQQIVPGKSLIERFESSTRR